MANLNLITIENRYYNHTKSRSPLYNKVAQADEFAVRNFGKLLASPLSHQTVKARQARKMVAGVGRAYCFSQVAN